MRSVSRSAFALLIGTSLCAQGRARLSLEDIETTRFQVDRQDLVAWGPAGRLLFHQNGRTGNTSWREPRTWAERSPPSGTRTQLVRGTDYIVAVRPGRDPVPAPPGSHAWQVPEVSPDYRWLAYVDRNDLWAFEIDSGRRYRFTRDGQTHVRSGKTPRVYQREALRADSPRAFVWSPDSRQLAFLRVDDRHVESHRITGAKLGSRPLGAQAFVRYPRPGKPLPLIHVGVVAPPSKAIRWVDLRDFGNDRIVVDMTWSPGGDRLLVQVQDREQSRLELRALDLTTGRTETLLVEHSDTWVDFLGKPRWIGDGSFVWLSERDGIAQLYHHAAGGQLIARVTDTDWPIYDIRRIDTRNRVWFTGGGGDPTEVQLFRIDLDDGNLRRVTAEPGAHRTSVNTDGTFFVDRYSSVARPQEIRICTGDGEVVRRVGSADVRALDAFELRPKRLHRIAARDGTALDVSVIRPPEHDPGRGHPIWVDVHGGPGTQTVIDEWSYDAWHQHLAHDGYVVFQVNVRTAGGHPKTELDRCYRQLGAQELRDLEDALDWLTAHDWADAERVGIAGWSYGGFLVGYAMTHSDRFRLGIAGAGVYDWREYSATYTERYLGRPSPRNPAYATSSVVRAAADLHGHLLLIHGTADRNVLASQSLVFARALRAARRSFEIELVPALTHAQQPSLAVRRRVRAAMREHLGR